MGRSSVSPGRQSIRSRQAPAARAGRQDHLTVLERTGRSRRSSPIVQIALRTSVSPRFSKGLLDRTEHAITPIIVQSASLPGAAWMRPVRPGTSGAIRITAGVDLRRFGRLPRYRCPAERQSILMSRSFLELCLERAAIFTRYTRSFMADCTLPWRRRVRAYTRPDRLVHRAVWRAPRLPQTSTAPVPRPV